MGASVWRLGRTEEEILGEGCGGLDGGKCLESGTNRGRDLWRRMWRTGWGQMSGEWDEQRKRSWEKDVEDWMGASVWRVGRTEEEIFGEGCGGLDGGKCLEIGTNRGRDLGRRMWRTGWGQVSGEWDEQRKRSLEKDVEDWMGESVWRVGRTEEEILGEGCGGLDGGKCLEIGMNRGRDLGRRMWRTGWGQVSGDWDEQRILGEGCGGLDGGKCLESGTNRGRDLGRRMWRTGWGQVSGDWDEQRKRSWEKDVEDWMGASVWRLGRTEEEILGEGCGGLDGGKCLEIGTNRGRYLGRRMWRTGWGQVSGEWDEQRKRSWEKDVEDWMGASVWRLGRTEEEILGEGCGGLDGGKCLEIGTNSRRYLGCGGLDGGKCLEIGTNRGRDLGRRMWRTGWGQVSGDWDEQRKRSWEKDVEDWMGASVWRLGRTEDRESNIRKRIGGIEEETQYVMSMHI